MLARMVVKSMLRMAALIGVTALLAGCQQLRPPRHVAAVERTMTVTGYCKCGVCCNWRRTWLGSPVIASGPNAGKPKAVGVTSSGAHAWKGTISADTSRYPFGTIMYIDGYGYGRVEDTGSKMKGDHIDLFFHSHAAAQQWGVRRRLVRVWFAGGK